METVKVFFCGIEQEIPLIGGSPMEYPYDTLEAFDSYCGAGNGVGNWVVPESIFAIPIKHCCFTHDTMFEIGEPTWQDFWQSNKVFRQNIVRTIEALEPVDQRKDKYHEDRYYRADTYYMAVNSDLGRFFYKRKKGVKRLIYDP